MRLFGRVGIVLVLGAVIAVAVVAWSLRPGRYDGWVETTGTVIDHRVTWSTDSETRRTTELRAPVVEFLDESGKRVVVTSSTSSSAWPAVGSNVRVRYPAGQPTEAQIGEEGWFVPIFFGIWAVVLGIVGITFVILARMIRSTAPERAPTAVAEGVSEDIHEPAGIFDEASEGDMPDDPWPRYSRSDDE